MTRRWLFRLILAGLGIGCGLGLGEAAVRTGRITPTHQIVRGHGVHLDNGVPVWEASDDRENKDCPQLHPDWKRVLFFGNSITYGAGMMPKQTFTELMGEGIHQLRPNSGVCMMNFAQPGFNFLQMYALASELIPKYKPAVAVLQADGPAYYQAPIIWDARIVCARAQYVMVGESAYDVSQLKVRADGFPGIRGVPDLLNQFLFLHSYLYQYESLGAAGETNTPGPEGKTQVESDVMTCRTNEMEKFAVLARASGATPLLHLASNLDYSLGDLGGPEGEVQDRLVQWATDHGLPAVRMRRLLADQDNSAMRMDSAHLSREGHRKFAERLQPIIVSLLDGTPPNLSPIVGAASSYKGDSAPH